MSGIQKLRHKTKGKRSTGRQSTVNSNEGHMDPTRVEVFVNDVRVIHGLRYDL